MPTGHLEIVCTVESNLNYNHLSAVGHKYSIFRIILQLSRLLNRQQVTSEEDTNMK